MTSLLDIAELSETVTVRGVKLKLTGLGADGIGALLGEFPEIRVLMAGTNDMKKDAMQALMSKAPNAIASIIAAAAGMPGDKAGIAKVQTFTVGEQMECLAPILRMTFPQGPGNFIQALNDLAAVVGVRGQAADEPDEESGKAADTK